MLNPGGLSRQPLEVKDFSGGMTDNYLGSGDLSKYQKADNMTIGDDGKLLTREGLVVDDTSNARVPSATRINALTDLRDTLIQQAGANLYINSSGFTTVTGPTGNAVFPGAASTVVGSFAKIQDQLVCVSDDFKPPTIVYKDGATWKARTLGLPAVNTATINKTGGGIAAAHLYSFHWQYKYTIDGVEFLMRGPVAEKTITTAPTNNFNTLPVIANSTTHNYDTASSELKLIIYRTQTGGDVFYKVGEVANGVTTFADTILDANLTDEEILYTTGGDLDDQAPPAAKYAHVVGDTLVVGHYKEDGVTYANNIRLSKRFKPYSMPPDFDIEFNAPVTGLASINTYPLVFTKTSTDRLDGFLDDAGNGSVTKKSLSTTIGTVSQRSIVTTRYGVFFAGPDGFYMTDGNSVTRVSEDINTTYKKLVNTSNIEGAYDSVHNRIVWATQLDEDGTDNDTIFVMHLNKGLSSNMPFTTWSGGDLDPTNFSPSALHFLNNTLYQGDSRGYLLKYSDDAVTDAKINTATLPINWLTNVIIYEHLSLGFDFGSTFARKWVPQIILTADNSSSLSLQISSNNDNSGLFIPLGEISYTGNIAWEEYSVAFGDANIRWDYFPAISAKRRFPAGELRLTYKQIRLTNSYTVLDSSAQGGLCSTNGATNTATLDGFPTQNWPPDCENFYLSLANDDYTAQYQISARTDQTLTLVDTVDTLQTLTGSAWKVKGYKLGEILKLISYVIVYDFTSSSQDPARSAQ